MEMTTLKQIIAELTVIEETHEGELTRRARAVVDARYYGGDDGWDRLKEAIGNLEDLVGRSKQVPAKPQQNSTHKTQIGILNVSD